LQEKRLQKKSKNQKIKKSIFSATKPTINQPFIGVLEENLTDLNQGHRYLVEGNYKIIYRVVDNDIYITDVFDCRQNPIKMKRHIPVK
jgi:toxin ParE1/3/4